VAVSRVSPRDDAVRSHRPTSGADEIVAAPSGPAGKRKAGEVRSLVGRVFIWILLAALVVWTVLPFFVTVVSSLQTRGEVFANPGFWPKDPSIASYREVLGSETFLRTLMNSIIVGVGTTVLTIVIAVPAAYAFARFRFRGRHFLLLFMLIPRLIPNLTLMVPLYRLAVELGAIDKRMTLIIVYTGMLLPLAVWLLVGFYEKVPRDIEEAASVDGASTFNRIRYIVLPLSIPALITIGVLAFREAWNEFTLVLVLTTTPGSRTLPYELFAMQGIEGIPNYPGQAAFALITVVPFVLVYMRIEKYVVQGITSGAVK
jgi:ABC-type glycerol-3-phosphate transport system permease component